MKHEVYLWVDEVSSICVRFEDEDEDEDEGISLFSLFSYNRLSRCNFVVRDVF